MRRYKFKIGKFVISTITIIVCLGVVAWSGYLAKDYILSVFRRNAIKDTVNKPSDEIKKTKKLISELQVTNELMLVNTENTIKDSVGKDIVDAFGTVPLSVKDIKMHKNTLKAVDGLFNEAVKAGHDKFFVNSGHRTQAKQKKLYTEAKDKTFVQKPGASEHQTGYALDIAFSGLTNEQFADSNEFKWLRSNAWKQGFLLRYPKDKTDITKISYEPWHYRYVGVVHAYYCYRNKLCLEEYLDSLLKMGSYSVKIGEDSYTVHYATPKDGSIEVPKNGNYTVSTDNRGGYIVTVKE